MVQRQFDLILTFSRKDFLVATAIKEFLEYEDIRVLMAVIESSPEERFQLQSLLKSEALLAITISASAEFSKLDQYDLIQESEARNHRELLPFHYWLNLKAPSNNISKFEGKHQIQWNWSFKTLVKDIKQMLIGRKWSPLIVANLPAEKPSSGMQIKGTRNVQVGSIQSEGNIDLKA